MSDDLWSADRPRGKCQWCGREIERRKRGEMPNGETVVEMGFLWKEWVHSDSKMEQCEMTTTAQPLADTREGPDE